MNIIYLVFGNDFQFHQQVVFSILSILQKGTPPFQIFVYTDTPAFYAIFADKVQVIYISQTQIEEWKGKYDLFFRTKIKAIEYHSSHYPNEALLYLDGDTFLRKNGEEMQQLLQDGKAFMHKKEGALYKLPTKTERKIWDCCKGKRFAEIEVNEQTEMWNAGVIGIPVYQQNIAIEKALRLCDEMCEAGASSRLLEQLSFSIALQNTYGLVEVKDIMAHYWGNKPTFNAIIQQFLIEETLKCGSLKDMIEHFPENLPPERLKVSNTKKKGIAILEKIFPDKIIAE